MYKEIILENINRQNVLNLVGNVYGGPQMTDFESSFLTGIIRDVKPKKIVEIGVAAGGTTSIILDSLEMYSDNYRLFSLDLNNDINTVGTISEVYKKLKPITKGTHETITGKYAPESIELIGDKIDLIVFDTIHKLPGEILDFLVFFPYLSTGCFVVLHDTSLNHQGKVAPNRDYATKLLFDVVSADKYINFDESNDFLIPNIAAFKITNQTSINILNIISSLSLTWEYFPEDRELRLYNDLIRKNYDTLAIEVWDAVLRLQENSMLAIKSKHPKYLSFLIKYRSPIYWFIMLNKSFGFLIKYGPHKLIKKILNTIQ